MPALFYTESTALLAKSRILVYYQFMLIMQNSRSRDSLKLLLQHFHHIFLKSTHVMLSPRVVMKSHLAHGLQVILSILQIKKLLQMDTAQIRFHAVHRIDKRKGNKYRPIIARSVCREDRDKDFARKQGVKESKVRGRLHNRWLCKSYTR